MQYRLEWYESDDIFNMTDISAKFGQNVKRIRLEKGLSQGRLADILGVHPTDISGIERGLRNMNLKNIERLAQALEVSVVDLIE